MATWVVRGCIVGMAVSAAVWDVRLRRIPHWLTLPMIVLGLGAFTLRMGLGGLAFSGAGAAAAFVLFLVPALLGGIGGGDVWLATALGALGGPMFVMEAAACGCLCVLLVWAEEAVRKGTGTLSRGLPMAPGLAAGALTILALTYGTWAGIVTGALCLVAAGLATALAPEPASTHREPTLPTAPAA